MVIGLCCTVFYGLLENGYICVVSSLEHVILDLQAGEHSEGRFAVCGWFVLAFSLPVCVGGQLLVAYILCKYKAWLHDLAH